jgi:hypothetical protein
VNTTSRQSLRDCVNAQCKACIYDPYSSGTWREQVAACTNGGCPLFSVRPVPRECTKGGGMCPVAIAAVRQKLDERIGRRSLSLGKEGTEAA